MYLTGGTDYELDQASLTFLSGASVMQQMCVTVNSIGDDLIDGTETFLVFFTLATPDIFQGESYVTVTITDDRDSECNLY